MSVARHGPQNGGIKLVHKCVEELRIAREMQRAGDYTWRKDKVDEAFRGLSVLQTGEID